jgi:S-(hydroxymethyl)glutathione dehydrogenase/alcohol dehydrogenase
MCTSVVESVGDHVHEVGVGDAVVPVFLPQCGECADCVSARSNICSALPYRPGVMPRDGTTRFSLAATGEPVHSFLCVSSFAEYTVVDVAHLVKLDVVGPAPALPPEKACLLSCGVTTGTRAHVHTLPDFVGRSLSVRVITRLTMPCCICIHMHVQELVRLGRLRRWSPAPP